jgi:uncharacterized membrane protein AbrB (regulator of aidB expression)
MSEAKKKKKKKTIFFIDWEFLQYMRLIFLIVLAAFLVYLYYLHTKGVLLTTADMVWKKHQKTIEVTLGIITYSAFIYFLGYRNGKKG